MFETTDAPSMEEELQQIYDSESSVAIEHARQKGYPWYSVIHDNEISVVLAGCGGIGSWTALALSRLGIPMVLYDMDTIEAHNIGGQLFQRSSVGLPKTAAVKKVVEDFNTEAYVITKGEFEPGSEIDNIAIAAFDSAATRKMMFQEWKKHVETLDEDERRTCLFIDPRIGDGESYNIRLVRGDEPDVWPDYEKSFEGFGKGAKQPCTAQATSYTGMVIGGRIAGLLVNFLTTLHEDDVHEREMIKIETVDFKSNNTVVNYEQYV